MLEEGKDPAIKLFGKTISLPEIASSTVAADRDDGPGVADGGCSCGDGGDNEMGCSRCTSDAETEARYAKARASAEAKLEGNGTDANSGVQILARSSDEFTLPSAALSQNENSQVPSAESEFSTVQQASNTGEEEHKSHGIASQDKSPKKPDKILPCPRCNSMETKFCYFNNYNVNQPRHFCKNCQRYWTAGGTMRNMPVGAGRRKSKSSAASQYRHFIVSESPLQKPGADIPNRVHCPALRSTNGSTLLAFGSDNPVCDSMTSILNLVENGIHNPDLKVTATPGAKGGMNQIDGAGSIEGESRAGPNEQGGSDSLDVYPPPLPWFPGLTWPYLWNSAQWGPQLPIQGFGLASGLPVAFYSPGAYWGCSVPGTWAIPWAPSPQSHSKNGSNSSSSPSPNSPTLGKHSRDGNILRSSSSDEADTPKGSAPERCLWYPKTLRIDDPDEAAKSSIWTTLGIKNPKPDSICGGGIFKACFSSKGDKKERFVENPRTLDVNPASLSRFQNFNETS